MLDVTIIKTAMLANIPSPTADQISAINDFANAIKTFVEGATIVYSAGLIAPPGTAGGPVTGVSGMTIT